MKNYNIEYDKDYKWDLPTMLQGDLAYIVHPNQDRQGWYQKLRKRENSKVGYLQITGTAIGTFVGTKTIEKPFDAPWDSRATHVVRGGEDVSRFIGSNYEDESVVECMSKNRVYSEIKRLENELNELKMSVKNETYFKYK